MGILRSEQMKHGTLVLPPDRARYFVDLIGSTSTMQFEDMNTREMQRPYKKYIQRMDEMERKIRFLMDELTRVPGTGEVISGNIDSFCENCRDHPECYKLDDVEGQLDKIYKDFVEFKENNNKLIKSRNANLEERFVLETAMASMAPSRPSRRSVVPSDAPAVKQHFETSASVSLLSEDSEGGHRRSVEAMFSTVAGVLLQDEQDRFARTLFRATRGNTFTHFQPIYEPMMDPVTGKEQKKSVFVVYYQDSGLSVSAMSDKIRKLCAAFGVNMYEWPASHDTCREMQETLKRTCMEVDTLLKAHENHVRGEAQLLLDRCRIDGNSLIEEWRMFCVKEKSIYATLNLFEGHSNLRADCWYPASEEDQIRSLLIRHSGDKHGQSSAVLVSDRSPPKSMPPTYIRRNELTEVFQELVDTYGVPRYQEANPALFAIITFPFLFGIMYGDIGHGLMLLAAGLAIPHVDFMRSNQTLYKARYIITMMGFFAIYAANDFFSIGLNIFGTRWLPPADPHKGGEMIPNFNVTNQGGVGPYPFGLDPAWHGATNELIYVNSMKMKVSVVVGVSQMLLGLFLRCMNTYHEKSAMDFMCECLPMLVFMICFFGFMDFMILYKWVTPMERPPDIIQSMIAMGMFGNDPNPMFGTAVPFWLMIACIMSVPWMLIPKPVLLYYKHKAAVANGYPSPRGHVLLQDEESGTSEDGDEEGFEIGEVVIHQIIETIEYVLGTVSHTASYLRLWALSLAHQQLSLVFFQNTLTVGLTMSFPMNGIALYFLFGMWLGATVGVLLGMDVLECFLHTLRLHWVEFQSKFYKADGYPFVPYRHRTILESSQ
eukprot:CAMPEP_0178465122 /NCGR_PEP_ID=MMETSP0689_2-20121128/51194_1 /TAXON_ID=160604 /ORGANISM="Amphidinium massartii, Strain CS-259" /LENGTH=826 /DNA_ID=CAMNT_0020092043 /DNA_START=135 /DNA_END=2616 /DNA_ORIENTATION=+